LPTVFLENRPNGIAFTAAKNNPSASTSNGPIFIAGRDAMGEHNTLELFIIKAFRQFKFGVPCRESQRPCRLRSRVFLSVVDDPMWIPV
jgi:hypothetical protein